MDQRFLLATVETRPPARDIGGRRLREKSGKVGTRRQQRREVIAAQRLQDRQRRRRRHRPASEGCARRRPHGSAVGSEHRGRRSHSRGCGACRIGYPCPPLGKPAVSRCERLRTRARRSRVGAPGEHEGPRAGERLDEARQLRTGRLLRALKGPRIIPTLDRGRSSRLCPRQRRSVCAHRGADTDQRLVRVGPRGRHPGHAGGVGVGGLPHPVVDVLLPAHRLGSLPCDTRAPGAQLDDCLDVSDRARHQGNRIGGLPQFRHQKMSAWRTSRTPSSSAVSYNVAEAANV